MNKKFYLLPILLLVLVFTSCEETKEAGKYDNWRARNEAFIDSIANAYANTPNHGGLDSIRLISDPYAFIYYKKKTPVVPEGQEPVYGATPLYTDSVTVYYKGSYINKDMFDGNFDGVDPSLDFSRTTAFNVNEVVVGWTEILQRMRVGERWEVYIPYKFGYGTSDYTAPYSSLTIPAYSTLVFDIQLLTIEKRKTLN